MEKVTLTSDASGAAEAGSRLLVAVIVDVIDFSTSMEAAIDAGAAAIFGAAPVMATPPVKVNSFLMGSLAGLEALRLGTDVIVLAEPRVGDERARREAAAASINGIESTGAKVTHIIPNLGAEIPKLVNMNGKVVLGATCTGGTAFDAAVSAGSPAVLTGTIARTMLKSGLASAQSAARRALREAHRLETEIAVVAASGNSIEDMLAAEYIYKVILGILRN